MNRPGKAPRTAAIYVRISRDKEGAGLGVSRQEQDCRALAQRLGWSVHEVFADNDISAYSGRVRPRYRDMLEDIASGQVNAVICWHTDRLHRNTREQLDYIELSVARNLPTETVTSGTLDLASPNGRAAAITLGAWARAESEHKAERIRRKYQQMAESGQARGAGRRPFGYEQDGVTIKEDEAAEVRLMTQRVIAGDSLASIMRDLNEREIGSVTGKAWRYSSLRAVLLRPRNAGLMQYQGEVIGDGDWPALVSKDEFLTCKALLEDPARRTTTGGARRHLLPGIAKCGKCGRGMKSGRVTDRYGKRYNLYRCCVHRSEERLDALVSRIVLLCLVNTKARRLFVTTSKRTPQASTKEREDIEMRLGEAAEAYASGDITMAQLTTMTTTLRERLAAVDSQLVLASRGRVVRELVSGRDDIAKRWKALPLSRKRAVIDALLEITVLPLGRDHRSRAFHEGVTIRLKADPSKTEDLAEDWLDWLTPRTAVVRYPALRKAEAAMTSTQERRVLRAFSDQE